MLKRTDPLMSFRMGWAHPLGVVLCGVSLLLAALIVSRDAWASTLAVALAAWGLLAGLAVCFVACRLPAKQPTSEPRKLATPPQAIAPESVARSGEALSSQPEVAHQSADEFRRSVEEALRRLNNPAALTKCRLIDRLPHTLQETRARRGDIDPARDTPLEHAQALIEVLNAAIERLKPSDRVEGAATAEALQYEILQQEYRQGLTTSQIMIRHSISESTFHRHRSTAIHVLADELRIREQLLSQAQADLSDPR